MWDVFHYLYALLHHPGYRERYAANLKRCIAGAAWRGRGSRKLSRITKTGVRRQESEWRQRAIVGDENRSGVIGRFRLLSSVF